MRNPPRLFTVVAGSSKGSMLRPLWLGLLGRAL